MRGKKAPSKKWSSYKASWQSILQSQQKVIRTETEITRLKPGSVRRREFTANSLPLSVHNMQFTAIISFIFHKPCMGNTGGCTIYANRPRAFVAHNMWSLSQGQRPIPFMKALSSERERARLEHKSYLVHNIAYPSRERSCGQTRKASTSI